MFQPKIQPRAIYWDTISIKKYQQVESEKVEKDTSAKQKSEDNCSGFINMTLKQRLTRDGEDTLKWWKHQSFCRP
jgi:hypothetical protein